jgi:hypothetical protein
VAPTTWINAREAVSTTDRAAYAGLVGQLVLPSQMTVALFPGGGQRRSVWREDALAEGSDLQAGERGDIRATVELPRKRRD